MNNYVIHIDFALVINMLIINFYIDTNQLLTKNNTISIVFQMN
jgi:hypothetical protein